MLASPVFRDLAPKLTLALISIAIALSAAPAEAGALSKLALSPLRGDVAVYYGIRSFTPSNWTEPVRADESDPASPSGSFGPKTHNAFGLTGDVGVELLPVYLNVGLFYSRGSENVTSGVKRESSTLDYSIGAKLKLPILSFVPYIGGGLLWINVKENDDSPTPDLARSDSASDSGYYLTTGAYLKVPGGLNIGVDLRASSGLDVTIYGGERANDYHQIAAMLGWRF